MNDIVVIGLGNLLLTDESIGVRLATALSEHPERPSGVDVLEMGTSGFAILHELEERRVAVFVDCAMMDAPPGTMRRFSPDDVVSRKVTPKLSLHEGDLMQTLALARKLGMCPADVLVYGIQPDCVDPGDDLSSCVAARFDEYVGTLISDLRDLSAAGPPASSAETTESTRHA